MKSIPILILTFLLLLFLSCSEDSPTDPGDGGNNKPDATATVGTEGGTVEYESVKLTVPAGAFDVSTELGLSNEQTDAAFSGTAISPQYNLGGLPESFSQPIEVTLQSTSAATGEVYVAVGYIAIPTSLQQEKKVFEYLEAEVLEGGNTIVASIPPTAGLTNFAKRNVDGTFSISIAVIGGHSSYTTSAGHFKVQFPTSVANDIPQLGSYLEEAYQKVSAMGFSYTDRSEWPVVVKVKKLDASVDGYFSASIWGDNCGTMEFNMDKLGDSENLRATAGHEFLHLAQDLYDPRSPFSRVKFSPVQLWLDEASSVWIEEKYSSLPNYRSVVRAGNVMAPFDGMHKEGGAAATHGYGMSAMIKYLTGKYGDEVVSKMYKEIFAGKHPVTAVMSSIPDAVSIWYPEFLKKYTLGEIYDDVPTAMLISYISTQKHTISSLQKDSTNYSYSAPNLSGHFYYVRLDFADSDEENASAIFTAANNDIIIYSFKGTDIKYENWGYGSVTISDLMSFKKNDRHLLALVCNTNFSSPKDGRTDVAMNIKVVPAVTNLMLPFTHVEFRIKTDLNMQDQDGNMEWEYTFLAASPFQGGGFDASGNYYVQWSDSDYEGMVTAKVNLSTGILEQFYITYVEDYSAWGEMDYCTLTLVNMEPDYVSDTELEYYEYYSGACDHIGHINYKEEFSTGDFSQGIGWRCNDNTEITVRFYMW